MITDAPKFFHNFYTIVNSDLKELEIIADKGEISYREMWPPGQIQNTTIRPDDLDKITHYSHPSRCTIPLTMTILSSMEIIGRLISSLENKSFLGRLESFSSFGAFNLKCEEKATLRNIYRNGLMHGFFPKNKLGISFDSSNPDGFLFFIKKSQRNSLILNTNELLRLFRQTMEKLLNDKNLMHTKLENIETFINESEKENIKLINDLYLITNVIE